MLPLSSAFSNAVQPKRVREWKKAGIFKAFCRDPNGGYENTFTGTSSPAYLFQFAFLLPLELLQQIIFMSLAFCDCVCVLASCLLHFHFFTCQYIDTSMHFKIPSENHHSSSLSKRLKLVENKTPKSFSLLQLKHVLSGLFRFSFNITYFACASL